MKKEIYLAGGCFWGVERYFSLINGVTATQVGYANGLGPAPTYEEVCTGTAGFAETVQVIYEPRKAPLPFLLRLYLASIDPTSVNRQGHDQGIQYRTGIYYTDPADRAVALQALEREQAHHDRPLAVEVLPLGNFYPAEEYHQRYLVKNPNGYCHLDPGLFDQARQAKPTPDERWPLPSREELARRLTPQQYAVTQEQGTEPPFRNPYWEEERPGIYVDVTTGRPLFLSAHKFPSSCGWPSFSRPLDAALVEERTDRSHGMVRTEVLAAHSHAHLGHLFADGPKELGGRRYCINSAALRFIPREEMEDAGYGDLLPLVEGRAGTTQNQTH